MDRAMDVRPLTGADVEAVLKLCQGNPLFYAHHPPAPTRKRILEDMEALPPGKTLADKHFLGFWQGETLAGVMDLILGYPDDACIYIGFFMIDQALQGRGFGTGIVEAVLSRLRQAGFRRVELGIDRGNPQSQAFWVKNGFRETRRGLVYITMTRCL